MDQNVYEYLRKKAEEENKLLEMRGGLSRADRELQSGGDFASALSKASSGIGQIGGKRATSGFIAPEASNNEEFLAPQMAKVNQAKNDLEIASAMQKSSDDDPTSDVSASARAMVAQYLPKVAADPSFNKMSASTIKSLMPFMKEALEQGKPKESTETWTSTGKTDDQGNLILVSNRGGQKTGPKVSEAQNTKATVTDTQVEKMSKGLNELQDMSNSLKVLEENLGFDVNDAEASGDTLTVGGRKQDLPGVNLPLVGRTSFYSSDARGIQSMFDKMMNVTLKERSGAAVTSNELNRLKSEYEAGKFNTEADMIRGLKRLKAAIAKDFQNAKAGYRPESVSEYASRGGQIGIEKPVLNQAPGAKYGTGGQAFAAPPPKPKEAMTEQELMDYIKNHPARNK